TVSSSNTDWTVSAPGQVSVAAGTTETVSVDITIPQDAADGEFSDITLNATSQNGTQADEDTMRVNYDHTGSEVIVTAPGDQTETDPGTYTYNFDVENNGSADDTYDLTVSSSNTDWTVSAPGQVSVAAGTTETVSVDITIPQDAADGEFSDITLNATSQNGTQADEETMQVSYEHLGSDVVVRAPGDTIELAPGTYTYNFEVENVGNADDTYDLTVESSNVDWSVTAPNQVTVVAGEMEIVVVEVIIPEGVNEGDQSDIILNATSQNGTHTSEDMMTITYEEYTLTIENPDHGKVYVESVEVTEPEQSFAYPSGYEVEIEVIADQNYQFLEWIGDNETIEDPISNLTTITMEGDFTITAEIVAYTNELTVSSSTGGEVINPGEGAFEYDSGKIVELEAVPDEGYHFVGWTGDNGTIEDPEANATAIEMLGDYEITAEFSIDVYSLSINVEGGGSTSPEEGNHTYEYGEEVTLQAVAEDGWVFSRWSGDVSGEDEEESEINILVDSDKEITAHFLQEADFEVELLSPDEGSEYYEGDEVIVEYTVTNLGEVETTQTIEFSVYDEDSELVFQDEENVTLGGGELVAEEVYEGEFVWDIEEGQVGEFNLVVSSRDDEDENKVTVSGESIEYELTIEKEGKGSTEPSAGTYTYQEGKEVEVTATPAEGWEFVEWTGDETGTEPAIDVAMNENKSLTAHFEKIDISIEITSPGEGELFAGSDITVEWESANANYHEVSLNEEEWIDVGESTTYTFEDVNSGYHTIEVRAILAEDIFALDSLNITVDTEPPELELISPESGEEITRSNVTIEWTASDDISGIDHFEVRLEGGEWVRVDETEYGFEDLEEGNHTVMVRAIDNAGNPSEIESEFTVTIEEGPSSFFEGLQAIWLILLLIPIFLIAFLLFWRRREEEEEEKEALLLKSKADKGEEAESEWASEESLDSEEKAALEELEEESELGEEELEGEEEPTEIDEKELEAELDEELKMEEEEVEAAGSAGAVSAAAAASEEEEESMRECPECGEKVSKEKEFCPECGAELKEEEEIGPVDDEIFVECDECGFLLTDEGLDECPYCGAPIEKDTSGEEE
ncbi:MAG: InlB B-repeat-containing protein, partial [Candidatus Natronoplasma sp.]